MMTMDSVPLVGITSVHCAQCMTVSYVTKELNADVVVMKQLA